MYISCFLFSLYRRYRLDYFWMLELWKLPSSFFYWMNLHIANFVRIRVYHPVWKNKKNITINGYKKSQRWNTCIKCILFWSYTNPRSTSRNLPSLLKYGIFQIDISYTVYCLLTQFRSCAVHEKFIRAAWILMFCVLISPMPGVVFISNIF